jgi:hypothetical protein
MIFVLSGYTAAEGAADSWPATGNASFRHEAGSACGMGGGVTRGGREAQGGTEAPTAPLIRLAGVRTVYAAPMAWRRSADQAVQIPATATLWKRWVRATQDGGYLDNMA